MIFNGIGKLTDFFYILGMRHFPTHLLLGGKPTLFEAGVSCLGPLYVSEIRRVLAQNQPEFLFLTHVHFDHCGTAGFLKETFPMLKVAASRRAAEIVRRPNAIETMSRLNQATSSWVDAEAPGLAENAPFKPFDVDLALTDGDCIEIGKNLSVHVMETPGHTWDGLSYYIPKKKLLIAGESAGCLSPNGFLYTEFLVDFDAYIAAIDRLARLEVDILCQSHHQLLTGEDAKGFFARSRQAAETFRQRIRRVLNEENGDLEKTALRIKAEEYDPEPHPKQPEQAYLINLAAKVKLVAGQQDRTLLQAEK